MQRTKPCPVFWQPRKCWRAGVRTGMTSWQPGTAKPFLSYAMIHFTAIWRQWCPSSPQFQSKERPGKPGLSISVLILLCGILTTPLHRNLPPAGIAVQQQEHTRVLVLCWIGLEPEPNSHKWEFLCPVHLASTKTALLQFVTIYLAAFIPLVPPVETEIGNNRLESIMERSPSLHWDTIIYRIIASLGEILRLSFGPHMFSSWSFPFHKLLAWNKTRHWPQCCNIT